MRPLPLRPLLLATLATVCASAGAQTAPEAGPLPVAAIVSDLGPTAARGRLERRVLEAWTARQRALGGIFGRELALTVRGDGGDPARAARLAGEAIDDGVLALVCCTTPAATRSVSPLAAAAGVPLLSLSTGGDDEAAGWQFVLAPSDAVALQAVVGDAYARGVARLGVLTLDGPFGDRVLERLEGFLAAPGLTLEGVARYPADAEVLTPEALWVATRQPGAIVAWGLRRDVGLAVDGLRRRGWEGPVYVRPALLDPQGGGLPPGLDAGVRIPVAPASVPDIVPPEAPQASWIADARALGGGTLESAPGLADGARAHDAVVLLARALEQAATYGVPAGDLRGARLALRDALVALPATTLAAGRYDLSMERTDAALAEGLAMARPHAGGLAPAP